MVINGNQDKSINTSTIISLHPRSRDREREKARVLYANEYKMEWLKASNNNQIMCCTQYIFPTQLRSNFSNWFLFGKTIPYLYYLQTKYHWGRRKKIARFYAMKCRVHKK